MNNKAAERTTEFEWIAEFYFHECILYSKSKKQHHHMLKAAPDHNDGTNNNKDVWTLNNVMRHGAHRNNTPLSLYNLILYLFLCHIIACVLKKPIWLCTVQSTHYTMLYNWYVYMYVPVRNRCANKTSKKSTHTHGSIKKNAKKIERENMNVWLLTQQC